MIPSAENEDVPSHVRSLSSPTSSRGYVASAAYLRDRFSGASAFTSRNGSARYKERAESEKEEILFVPWKREHRRLLDQRICPRIIMNLSFLSPACVERKAQEIRPGAIMKACLLLFYYRAHVPGFAHLSLRIIGHLRSDSSRLAYNGRSCQIFHRTRCARERSLHEMQNRTISPFLCAPSPALEVKGRALNPRERRRCVNALCAISVGRNFTWDVRLSARSRFLRLSAGYRRFSDNYRSLSPDTLSRERARSSLNAVSISRGVDRYHVRRCISAN